jgi:uncharacterized protein YprB with RNaseH-like and TPR domain
VLFRCSKNGEVPFRRCDYSTEEDFNLVIRKYLEANPKLWFSFNGSRFDHLILNRILGIPYSRGSIKGNTELRRLNYKGCTFLDLMKWVPPCSLSEMARLDRKRLYTHT